MNFILAHHHRGGAVPCIGPHDFRARYAPLLFGHGGGSAAGEAPDHLFVGHPGSGDVAHGFEALTGLARTVDDKLADLDPDGEREDLELEWLRLNAQLEDQ